MCIKIRRFGIAKLHIFFALAMSFAGCSGDTGVLLTVVLDKGLSANQVQISFALGSKPQGAGTHTVPQPARPLAQQATILVLVPDAWDGQEADLLVQALMDRAAVGQGSGKITISRGEILKLSVKVACQGCTGASCGNGKLDDKEKCDTKIKAGKPGACPRSCNDKVSCTRDRLLNAGTCGAVCSYATINNCKSGDGCCPSSCNASNDGDCSKKCGNGIKEPNEKCDKSIPVGKPGACPKSCDDKKACTADALLNGGTCAAECSFTAITACKSGDACCPTGCNANNDGDCSSKCGNGVKESNEKCDKSIGAGKPGACPQSCNDGKACTADTLLNGGTCAAECSFTPITSCKGGDGCCPSSCTNATDSDCAAPPVKGWAVKLPCDNVGLGRDIALDGQGNIYVAGSHRGTLTLGSSTLTAQAQLDMYVAKLSPAGKILWGVGGGSYNHDDAKSIAVDAAGNSYTTGRYGGTSTFGSIKLTNQDSLYILKVDASGKIIWATSADGGYSPSGTSEGIALDKSGNIYFTGSFHSSGTFGKKNLAGNGAHEIFVAKLTTGGVWKWAVSAGGSKNDRGEDIAVDKSGNILVTGIFADKATFGSASLTAAGSQGKHDVFVTKLDSAGGFKWAAQAGSAGAVSDDGQGIDVDGAGNAYITGGFADSAKFGSKTLTASGPYDLFVAKVSPSGGFLWAARGGGASLDRGFAVAVDASGNAHVAGLMSGTGKFGSLSVPANSVDDILVARLSSSGSFNWAKSAGSKWGGNDDESGEAIAVDSAGNIYVVGHFTGSATFGGTTLTPTGGSSNVNAFVWKIPKP